MRFDVLLRVGEGQALEGLGQSHGPIRVCLLLEPLEVAVNERMVTLTRANHHARVLVSSTVV